MRRSVENEIIGILQERTNSKIRYARVHLEELKAFGPPDGSDYDKAHQESFLFHLMGVKDAFLCELNQYYAIKLPNEDLSMGKVRNALKSRGISSPELGELYELENNEESWFSKVKQLRDYSAHVKGVPRAYYLGGADHGKVKLKHPKSGELIADHFIACYEAWVDEMTSLINRLRTSALLNTQDKS